MKRILSFALLAVIAAGCTGSPKPTYYTLSSPTLPATLASNNLRVMVGPIALPESLDQPRLVVHSTNNEVKMQEYHRWAGSLKNDIGRVMGAQLALDLKTSDVWSFSQSTQTQFDYQVLIDVQNLVSKPDESVLLDVLWTVKSSNVKQPPVMGRSLVHEPVVESGMNAIVAAQSRAFARVGSDIARQWCRHNCVFPGPRRN